MHQTEQRTKSMLQSASVSSFSRQPRFPELNEKKLEFLKLPSVRSKRSATFGSEPKKSYFELTGTTPGPGDYSIPRDKPANVALIKEPLYPKCTPKGLVGPGSFDLTYNLKKTPASYSIPKQKYKSYFDTTPSTINQSYSSSQTISTSHANRCGKSLSSTQAQNKLYTTTVNLSTLKPYLNSNKIYGGKRNNKENLLKL